VRACEWRRSPFRTKCSSGRARGCGLPVAPRTNVHRLPSMRDCGRQLLLRVHEHRPRGSRRVRPRSHRNPRGRSTAFSSIGQRARRRDAAGAAGAAPAQAMISPRRRRRSPRRRTDGRLPADRRPARAAAAELRSPAVGRCRPPLPGLLELHHGVPHLLLLIGEDAPDLPLANAERWRKWIPGFTGDFFLTYTGSAASDS